MSLLDRDNLPSDTHNKIEAFMAIPLVPKSHILLEYLQFEIVLKKVNVFAAKHV